MTLDQLRYFTAAAKYEHVGRAARSIPISASVISHSVKHLEEELECSLFVRDKKKMRLTQQGLQLLELARNVLEKADGIKQELGKGDQPLSGHYRIAASPILATKVLTPVWTAMQKRFPLLTADIHSQPTWNLMDGILSGRIDLGIGFSPVPHPHLESEEIFRGHSIAVARKDHPIFKSTKKDKYKLLNEYPATMHIATDKIFMARHHPFFKTAHLEKNIVFGFDSDFVAIENLRRSDNWCLMLDIAAADFRQHLRSIPFPGKTESPYTVQIIRHKTRKLDPVLMETIAQLKQYMQKIKTWDGNA